MGASNVKLPVQSLKQVITGLWLPVIMAIPASVLAQGDEITPGDLNPASTSSSQSAFYNDGLTLDDYNRKIIRHYLDLNDQNVSTVTGILNIGNTAICRMI